MRCLAEEIGRASTRNVDLKMCKYFSACSFVTQKEIQTCSV
jgi:hypothetical protein